MADTKRDNPFLLPKRHSSHKYRDEFSRKSIKGWADDLSIGDVDKAALDLYSKLDRLNQLEISPANRFEILELLQPSISFVLDSLKKRFAHGTIPLSIGGRMVANVRQDILVQMVKAYKTVLAQLHDATITGLLFHKHTRSESLRRALLYLGETLLHSYMNYQPLLKYTWKELHGIYYYSVVNELQSAKDSETREEVSAQPGIEEMYKQILLLSLANPNSMLCGEAEKVNDLLKDWTPFIELVPIKRAVTAESFFLIDAQSDTMPCAPNLCKKEKIALGWYLVTDSLERVLSERVAAADAMRSNMRPTDAGALRLMKKLIDAWSQQIRPREIRNRTAGMVELICGLDSLHTAHGGEMLSQTVSGYELPTASSSPGHYVLDSSLLDNDEVLIEVEPGVLELQRVYNGSSRQQIKESMVEGKECIITNKSEKGYCLNWPDSGSGGTRVGELVGVNSINGEGNMSDPSLGVIRWMYAEQPGFLEIGVELLNGQVEPVILQRRQKGAKQADSIKGFLQRAEGERSYNLIAPPFYVAKHDRYKVITGSKEIPVNLTNIVDSTDSFVRFEFEQLSVNG